MMKGLWLAEEGKIRYDRVGLSELDTGSQE